MTIAACPPNTPPPHGVVVFNFADWIVDYPEFAGITQAKGQAAFNQATLVMANSCRSLIRDAAKREQLLYLLTAHVCFLRFGSNDGAGAITPAPGVVGRISSAHEGSVSVSTSLDGNNQNRAWFAQTQWGLSYWTATAKYRTMRYVPPPLQCCSGCGGLLGNCSCGIGAGIGPVGTGWPGYNGGSS
jgi:Protein of unknown function (DUF4054)